MRKFIFAVALFSACAQSITGTHPNIPATRHDIQVVIDHDGSGRKIVSMGNVTHDKAVVYTQTGKDEATRHEETWVKSGDGWKLETGAGMAGGGNAAPATN
jgi:hypothetical protein